MTQRLCRCCKNWHDIDQWPADCAGHFRFSRKQGDVAAPMFISDSIEVRSMLDGKIYTSKSRLRSTYRAAGVQEVGNEQPTGKRPTIKTDGIKADLYRTYAELTA